MKFISSPLHASAKTLASAALAAMVLLPGSAWAKERPDQIFYRDRTWSVRTLSGIVTEDTIASVAIEGRGNKVDSATVARVLFGTVPDSYHDAEGYAARGDFDNALKQFRMAADDSEARQVVRAAARLEAGKMLLRAGANGAPATVFKEAVDEFDRFLTDFPTSRLVPEVRSLAARARRLNGDAQAAGELGAAVFDEMNASPDDAYTTNLCLTAGIDGARSFFAAGDTATGNALLQRMQAAVAKLMAEAELEERDALRVHSENIALTEGWAMLADGRHAQAVTFFSGKLRADLNDDLRFSARLGQAQGLLGQKKYREAQIEFAAVSALAPTNRDDVAAALVGLALCTQNLPDSDATERIRGWVTSCLSQYGDTPAAIQARELAAAL